MSSEALLMELQQNGFEFSQSETALFKKDEAEINEEERKILEHFAVIAAAVAEVQQEGYELTIEELMMLKKMALGLVINDEVQGMYRRKLQNFPDSPFGFIS